MHNSIALSMFFRSGFLGCRHVSGGLSFSKLAIQFSSLLSSTLLRRTDLFSSSSFAFWKWASTYRKTVMGP